MKYEKVIVKPCPFCGELATLRLDFIDAATYDEFWSVECPNECCRTRELEIELEKLLKEKRDEV